MENGYSAGQRILLFLASVFGPMLILLYGLTWKVRWSGEENLKQAREKSGNVIYAFWHSNLLGLIYPHRFKNAGVMVSKSFDGEWIARIVSRLGYRVFRGSASRDGAPALLEMIKSRDSGDLALTVDGPLGPARKVKAGVIILASNMGLPLMPITAVALKAWRLKSWDRLIIPRPFSSIEVIRGKHITVPGDIGKDEVDRLSMELEEAINGLG